MRDNITNLKEGMEGLERKMMSRMEVSFEKMLELLQRQNESEETRRLRSIAEVVRKGKELGVIEKRILDKEKVHTIGEQSNEVAILEVREVQVVEREEAQAQRDPAVPQPKGTQEQQQAGDRSSQPGGPESQVPQGGVGQLEGGIVGGGGNQFTPFPGMMGGQVIPGGPGGYYVLNGMGGYSYVY